MNNHPMLMQLRHLIGEYFSNSDLNGLCFDLGINYQDLPGETLEVRAMELVMFCNRRGQLPDLITQCRKLRSGMNWPDIQSVPSPQDKQLYQKSQVITNNLPQPDYGQFIGREEEITAINKILQPYPQSQYHFISIDGVGGVGKSTLALEIGTRLARDQQTSPSEQFNAIIWVSAKQEYLAPDGIYKRKNFITSTEGISKTIVLELSRLEPNPLPDSYDTKTMAFGLLRRNRTLLIVDNLETLTEQAVDKEAIIEFIHEIPPPTKIIVTTRQRLSIAVPIRLSGMSESDANQLIKQECLKKRIPPLSNDESTKLYERTGGIPLAIVLGIGQIALGYTAEYVLQNLSSPIRDLARFCFEKSMELIREKAAHKLFLALSLTEEGGDQEQLGAISMLPQLDIVDGLTQLEHLSLINRDREIYKMIPLVRNYAIAEREQLRDMNELYQHRYQQWLGGDVVQGITKWLATQNIILKNYDQKEKNTISFEGDDVYLEVDRVALFLGERYESLVSTLKQIKYSLNSGGGFSQKLFNWSAKDISDITQFCLLLHKDERFVTYYEYNKYRKTIYVTPKSDTLSIKFFEGGWLQRFIRQKVTNFLKQHKFDFEYITNAQITLPNQKDFQFDLLYLINGNSLWIGCKSGKFEQDDIERYSQVAKTLDRLPINMILVIAEAKNNYSQQSNTKYNLTVVNLETFLDAVGVSVGLLDKAVLERKSSGQRSLETNPSIIQSYPEINLSTTLKRAGLRPVTEYRDTVILELIQWMQSLQEPTTLSTIKLRLAERLPISRSQLDDIIHAIVLSGCFLDSDGQPVKQHIASVNALISYDLEVIKVKCVESYMVAILKSSQTFFDQQENIQHFIQVVGLKALSPLSIQKVKKEMNLA